MAAQGLQGPWAWARCNSSTCDFGLTPTLTGLPSSGYWRPDLRTIRALRPGQLSSCYCPRGPWSRRPHEQSLPLAKYPGGCFATCVGSPGVVEADAGQHVAPPTPVLWRAVSLGPGAPGELLRASTHSFIAPRYIPHVKLLFNLLCAFYLLSSVQLLNRIQLFATLWTAGRQTPCPSPTPGVYSNPCPLSQ